MSQINRRALVLGTGAVAASAVVAQHVAAQTPAATPAATVSQAATPAPNAPVVANSDQFNVLFIRHGESEVNVAPIPGVADDGVTYPLTALGVQQVNELGSRLGNLDISAIYTSTRVRCIQTADGIAFGHGLTLNLTPGIVEIMIGDTSAATAEGIAKLFQAWATGDLDARLGDKSESLNDMLKRFLPPVNEAIDRYKATPKTLVFVAHGAILAGCLPHLFTNLSPAFALQHGLVNTGIVAGEFKDGKLVCTSWQGVPPQ